MRPSEPPSTGGPLARTGCLLTSLSTSRCRFASVSLKRYSTKRVGEIVAGRFVDMQTRIEGLLETQDRKVTFLFGSGLSNSILPSTGDLAATFMGLLKPVFQTEVRESENGKKGPAGLYQEAAKLVALHKGDGAIASIIRDSVLSAYRGDSSQLMTPGMRTYDEDSLHASTQDTSLWDVPDGYHRFANFYRQLPPESRGKILTTNFDPFLEISLNAAGVAADPEALDFDDPPALEANRFSSTQHVIHLHGYFASHFGINTVGQLERVRLKTETYLRHLLQGHLVVVLGYGGWDDVFTRMLAQDAGYRTLANAEVLWGTYEKQEALALAIPVIGTLDGRPGFHLFLGIDAGDLFNIDTGAGPASPLAEPLPRGFTLVNQTVTARADPRAFVEGGQPTWKDAEPGAWPRLTATQTLVSHLNALGTHQIVAAAIGPVAEGKSMALKQVAREWADSNPDWHVVWREAGTSPAADEALTASLGQHPTLVVVDDAETAIPLLRTLTDLAEANAGNVVKILLSCHDRHWSTSMQFLHQRAAVVRFGQMSAQDAEDITYSWRRYGLMPAAAAGVDFNAAGALLKASRGNPRVDGNSLFGAILAVREANSLNERIGGLMRSLDGWKVSTRAETTLADVFASICLQQHFLDADQSNTRGATRQFLMQLVRGDKALLDEAVLFRLGREVALTYAGDRVFARHPAIAESVVRWLGETGRTKAVCEKTAEAGARLRSSGAVTPDTYDAYMLAGSLPSLELALAAGRGAMTGAPRLLEARVNYISVARRLGDPALAITFARALAPKIGSFEDRRTATRGLLTEASLLLEGEHQVGLALGAAGLALHDPVLPHLNQLKAQRGLVSLSRLAGKLAQRGDRGAADIAGTTYALLETQFGSKRFAFAHPKASFDVNLLNLSPAALGSRLESQLTPWAKNFVTEWDVPFGSFTRDEWSMRYNGRLEYKKLIEAVT